MLVLGLDRTNDGEVVMRCVGALGEERKGAREAEEVGSVSPSR
jgi:hypothetical protein